jgi:hypothetical protein
MNKLNDRVKILFEDMSLSSNYQLLEWGKNDDELKDIANKRGISVPSKDLAIFKCTYAMVDKENLNKCTLPRKEVKKALKTLNAKAVDKDHLRRATIGHWLDAELDDNDIVAYGCFWKSNFPEEYEEIKKRMSEGKVKISFEAWGERIFKEDGSYNLVDIEFAGGALLFDTDPAFPDAEVIEFSNKNRVLEFAKVIEEGDNKNAMEKEKTLSLEESKLSFNWDIDNIARVVYQYDCPTCKTKGWQEVQSIDFENSKIKHKCIGCGEITETDLTPKSVIKKEGKKPKPVTAGSEVKDKKQEVKNEGGNTKVDEILKKYSKASVEEVVKLLEDKIVAAEASVTTITASVTAKDQEIATLKAEKETLTNDLGTVKTELARITEEAKVAKATLDKKLTDEKAALIKARRDELTEEFAKDLKDEDIMDETKYELAKTKKELALAKAGKPSGAQGGLEAGAAGKDGKDPVFVKQDSIQKQAFPG